MRSKLNFADLLTSVNDEINARNKSKAKEIYSKNGPEAALEFIFGLQSFASVKLNTMPTDVETVGLNTISDDALEQAFDVARFPGVVSGCLMPYSKENRGLPSNSVFVSEDFAPFAISGNLEYYMFTLHKHTGDNKIETLPVVAFSDFGNLNFDGEFWHGTFEVQDQLSDIAPGPYNFVYTRLRLKNLEALIPSRFIAGAKTEPRLKPLLPVIPERREKLQGSYSNWCNRMVEMVNTASNSFNHYYGNSVLSVENFVNHIEAYGKACIYRNGLQKQKSPIIVRSKNALFLAKTLLAHSRHLNSTIAGTNNLDTFGLVDLKCIGATTNINRLSFNII
jgi:hypothetical protein